MGLANATLLPEPITIAESHAAHGFSGGVAAVYSLGGNSFEASMVRPAPRSGFELLGSAQGLDPIGGVDFDEALAEHVRAALGQELDRPTDPQVQLALLGLPRECARAKQDLTVVMETDVVVGLPNRPARVPVTRSEFEEMIRPALQVTVDMLVRTVRSGGLAPAELDGVLLAGGSSRIPLIAELLAAQFPVPIEVEADPQVTAATGAALAACQIVSPPRPRGQEPARPGPVSAVGSGLGDSRSERNPDQYEEERGTPPPRPPVKITPLELPGMNGSRLVPGRGRGRGRG
jgi:molecular chaperone DnaK (HSP70)